MAVTFALVDATPNQLRYLVTHDGAGGDVGALPNTAAAGTPNFRNDAALFPLRDFPLASIAGFPPLPIGTLTQAQIRALLLADDPGSAVLTNLLVGRCKATLTPRAGATTWLLDAIIDAASPIGQSNPTYQVSTTSQTAATCYLDIVYQNTPDR